MPNENQEVWRTYPDYPWIEASNLGRIRTKDRYVQVKEQGKRLIKGKVLKQQLLPNSYMRVHLSVNGKKFNLLVHRIVATCFIPNPLGLPEVNHKDNNPENNAVFNLEWCTHEYNMTYREEYGVSASEATKVLRKSLFAIDSNSLKVLWFESQSEAARQLGVYLESINRVVKEKLNRTGGYWFCYADENAVEKVRSKFGNEVVREVERLMRES